MIALTQRLNERDEQILALQAELEAYDSHQKWAGEGEWPRVAVRSHHSVAEKGSGVPDWPHQGCAA